MQRPISDPDYRLNWNSTRTGWIPLALGLSAVILLWDLLELPQILSFSEFAFWDPGSNLTISYLMSHGYRPVIDFGYHYGLLGILADVAWFRAVPLTPIGYQAACIVCQLGVACAVARIARALEFGLLQSIFLFVAIGRAVIPTYFNIAHGLEAVLICFAVAEQARGARANALALTTAAVFAKPSMGFVYSGLLLTLTIVDFCRGRIVAPRSWFNQLQPALLVAISLSAILGIKFGFDVLWQTALPITGMGAYRTQNLGFFTAGSGFWHPVGVKANWHYYLQFYATGMIGLWAGATAYLIWGAITAARWLWEDLGTKPDSVKARRDEIVFSCALLHLTFIFFFFGNADSWIYYSYLLIAGTAAVPVDSRLYRNALCAIIVLGACTCYGLIAGSVWAWRTMSRTAATADLWSTPQLQDEWSRILAISKGRRTAVLHYSGAVEILYPQFERPTGVYFTPGLVSPRQAEREAARIESAGVVVLQYLPGWGGFALTPATERALARFKQIDFKQIDKGVYFSVYERR